MLDLSALDKAKEFFKLTTSSSEEPTEVSCGKGAFPACPASVWKTD